MTLSDVEIKKIAQDWVDRESSNYRHGDYRVESEDDSGTLFSMLEEDCETSWRIVTEIVKIVGEGLYQRKDKRLSSQLLGLLGAGDFEDLLHAHPLELIDRVVCTAGVSPDFAEMLKSTDRGDLTDSIWQRMLAATKS